MATVVIFVDVDDTLVRSVGTKRIPIPSVIRVIRQLKAQGAILYCWTRRTSPDDWKSRLYKQSPPTRTDLKIGFQISSGKGDKRVIRESPTRWAVLDEDVRRCLTQKFPYAILYTIEQDYILILAVMYCSREPGYWKSRR